MKLIEALQTITPSPVSDLAIALIAGPETRKDIEVTSVAEALEKAFLWRAHDKGYWTGVHAKLVVGDTPDTPLPAETAPSNQRRDNVTNSAPAGNDGLDFPAIPITDERAFHDGMLNHNATLPQPPLGMMWEYRGRGWQNNGQGTLYATVNNSGGCHATTGMALPCGFDDLVYFEAVPIVLEAGRRYRRRDGTITSPLAVSGLSYITDDCGGPEHYTRDGVWSRISTELHPRDIVAEMSTTWGDIVEGAASSPELTPQPPQLVLRVGSHYQTRHGRVVGPLEAHPSSDTHPFRIQGQYFYTPRGRLFSYGESDNDLVNEVGQILMQSSDLVEEIPTEIVTAEPAPLIIEDGKWYRRRDGSVVQLRPRHPRLSSYPWMDNMGLSYTAQGRFFGPHTQDNYDLIEEVPNPNE